MRWGRVVATLALILLTLTAGCGERSQQPLFQPLLSEHAERPLEIVAEKTLTRSDELARDYRHDISSRMPPQSREIATFEGRATNGPLHVVLDYAALPLENAEYPEHRAVTAYVSYACPKLATGCFANGSGVRSAEFYVGALNPSGVTRRNMYIDGKKRTVYF